MVESQIWGRRGWPTAAYGEDGQVWEAMASEYPRQEAYQPLASVVDPSSASPLSARAIRGFRSRLLAGALGRYPGFRDDVDAYAAHASNESSLASAQATRVAG